MKIPFPINIGSNLPPPPKKKTVAYNTHQLIWTTPTY